MRGVRLVDRRTDVVKVGERFLDTTRNDRGGDGTAGRLSEREIPRLGSA